MGNDGILVIVVYIVLYNIFRYIFVLLFFFLGEKIINSSCLCCFAGFWMLRQQRINSPRFIFREIALQHNYFLKISREIARQLSRWFQTFVSSNFNFDEARGCFENGHGLILFGFTEVLFIYIHDLVPSHQLTVSFCSTTDHLKI